MESSILDKLTKMWKKDNMAHDEHLNLLKTQTINMVNKQPKWQQGLFPLCLLGVLLSWYYVSVDPGNVQAGMSSLQIPI